LIVPSRGLLGRSVRYVPWARCVAVVGKLIGQPDAATGALATLRAATDPAAKGADYYAPDGRGAERIRPSCTGPIKFRVT
jgi:hypothetical protein